MGKRIGILTGGGDAPGLNAVIRAVVKSGVTKYEWQVFGIEESFNGLMFDDKKVWQLMPKDCRGLLTRGGTVLGYHEKVSVSDLTHYVLLTVESLVARYSVIDGDRRCARPPSSRRQCFFSLDRQRSRQANSWRSHPGYTCHAKPARTSHLVRLFH